MRQYSSYKISKVNLDRMKAVKKKYNFVSHDAALSALLTMADREGLVPIATRHAIFKDTKPIVITGPPGSGKTTLVK